MTELVEAGRRVAALISAEALALGDVGYGRAIWRAAGQQLPKEGGGRPPVPPGTPAENGWRARIMLFAPNNELEADSMPDMSPESMPDTMCNTLALVGAWVRETAEAFHTERRETVEGLDAPTLERSILSLRVSLSRNGGATWWRIPYKADTSQWRAMVRVERASKNDGI